MTQPETPPTTACLRGHVENGVVVVDDKVLLTDGQAVRIEPVNSGAESKTDSEHADRLSMLKQLFAEWTEEDGKLSDEEADRLHVALDRDCGLRLRPPKVD